MVDHVRTGLRKILELSSVFAVFQNLVGGHRARSRLVTEFINPSSDAKILDIGCGVGAILNYLPGSVQYVGYDLNPRYITSAQKKYKDRGQFFCARVTDAAHKHIGEFDIVLAIAILHHLNDQEARHLIKSAHQQLKSGGILFTIDGIFVANQNVIARYLISKDRGQHVRSPEGYMNLTKHVFSQVEGTILTDLLRVPYTHYVMRCTKS